jgi:replicative DNA helicase
VLSTIYSQRIPRELFYNLSDFSNTLLDQRLDAAEQKIFALRQHKRASNGPSALADISLGLFQQMEQLSTTGEVPAIPCGFYDLDNLLAGGFYPEDLIILGGRPSMGKSVLACSIAYQIAEIHQAPTLIFSLEMSSDSIVRRYLSNLAEIQGDKLRLGKLSIRFG